MKTAVLFLISFISIGAYAGSGVTRFECQAETKRWPQDLNVKTSLSGVIEVKKDNDYQVSYNLDLVVYEGEASECGNNCWAKFDMNLNLKNKSNYRPRKYINHAKFETYAVDPNTGDFSNVDLILPKAKINELTSNNESFKGYLILTYTRDHFGTTVPMECVMEISNAFELLEAKSNASASLKLKLQVQSKSECGEMDPYFFGDVCSYKARVLDGDESLNGKRVEINFMDYDVDGHKPGDLLSVEAVDVDLYYNNTGKPVLAVQ